MNLDLNQIYDFDWNAALPLIIPFAICHIILAAIALIDIYKNRKSISLPILWVILSIFVYIFGPVIYLIINKSRRR